MCLDSRGVSFLSSPSVLIPSWSLVLLLFSPLRCVAVVLSEKCGASKHDNAFSLDLSLAPSSLARLKAAKRNAARHRPCGRASMLLPVYSRFQRPNHMLQPTPYYCPTFCAAGRIGTDMYKRWALSQSRGRYRLRAHLQAQRISCPLLFEGVRLASCSLLRMVSQIRLGVSPMTGLGLGLSFVASAMGFNMATNTNLAVYWGQNSYGATNPSDTSGFQQPISYYCGSGIDTIPIAFLTEFYSTGNLPTIDLANTCNTSDDPVFPGTNLPNCTFLAADIESCQASGTAVTLSIGGATGSVSFSNDSEASAYAQVIWDLFLGGTSNTRPFGSAVLDGIDMDIEGGSQTGYTSFLTALRSLMNGGTKQYYITAAPQCPYPDAYIGTTLDDFSFDAVYVQFYNNYCGLTNYNNTNDWDFSTWDNWARTVSPNPNVKVYIGAPAAPAAAGSGYVPPSTITTILQQTQSQYSTFGGAMLWDASQAYNNGRYDEAVKSALTSGPGAN